MTLTTAEIRDHLNGITYPPNVTLIVVIDDPWEGPGVRIVGTVPDALNPGQTIDLGVTSYLSPNDIASREALDLWITWRFWRIAGHEAREFLQRDGVPLFDPHAVR